MKNSKEMLNRKTKTRTKSKILPNGNLVEQTVITEVTETFSSPSCTSAGNAAENKMTVKHDTYDANKSEEEKNRKNKTNKEKSAGSSVMPFQTLGKKQHHTWAFRDRIICFRHRVIMLYKSSCCSSFSPMEISSGWNKL